VSWGQDLEGVPTVHSYYQQIPFSDYPIPQLNVGGKEPSDSAAQFMVIGKDLNRAFLWGPAGILARGGGMVLDNMQLRRVIFVKVHFGYSGGPLRLDDVYFVDCFFDMPRNLNTTNFALAELSSTSSVTFSCG
jgi:hypothetical protein